MSGQKTEKLKYKNALKSFYEQMNQFVKSDDPRLSVIERQHRFVRYYDSLINAMDARYKNNAPLQFNHDVYYYNNFILDLNKELPHIFIENRELEDFFKNTKVHNLDTVRNFIEDNTAYGPYKDGQTKNLSYVLHTPHDAYVVNAMFRNACNNGKQYYLIVWNSNDENQFIELDEHTQYFTKAQDGSKTPPTLLNIAVNSMMYMAAFPECLIGGVPQNIVKSDKEIFKEKKNLTLKTSEVIVEKCERDSSGHIVTPHFRSGSFHYLKSDYYKDKKGKTVWWSPSMVKGHAKTIKDKNNKEEEFDLTR